MSGPLRSKQGPEKLPSAMLRRQETNLSIKTLAGRVHFRLGRDHQPPIELWSPSLADRRTGQAHWPSKKRINML
jgi:hypothetical protein